MKAKRPSVDVLEAVRALLCYDPNSGDITWKCDRGAVRKGQLAGTLGPDGYRRLNMAGLRCTAQQMAWFLKTGDWPNNQIAFLNRNVSDLRWENLTIIERVLDHTDIAVLRRLFSYDPATGVIRRLTPSSAAAVGHIANATLMNGYVQVHIGHKGMLGHRLAWALHYGTWPSAQIDHINGLRDDNRLANLREATSSQNNCNKRVHKASKSGLPGAAVNRNKFRARVTLNGKRHNVGTFKTAEEASAAYIIAVKELHGEFAGAVAK